MLEQLDLGRSSAEDEIRVHFGGPVEAGRGFVLHSTDYQKDATVDMENGIGLTATIDILRDIARGDGPQARLLALGYAGWGPGQLDEEIQDNAWLHVPADPSLVFNDRLDAKWDQAIARLGFDPSLLSSEAGRA